MEADRESLSEEGGSVGVREVRNEEVEGGRNTERWRRNVGEGERKREGSYDRRLGESGERREGGRDGRGRMNREDRFGVGRRGREK